ncbi:MAG: hypothetical protein AABY43_05295 [Candidatus Omnitrophota bacterium]
MVNPSPIPKANLYLLIGDNELPKLNKIESIKKELLPQGALDFNLEVLSAQDLEVKKLQEALLRLPIKTGRRLLILRNLQDLSKDCREIILGYLKKPHPWITLVLEGKSLDKDIEQIANCAQTLYFRKAGSYDVFALGRAIDNKNQVLALDILSDLLLRGEKVQKILGGLIWHWENTERYLSQEKIKKGFEALLEADLNIKRSLLKPNIALELLVVKLMLLA